jgi:nucleoside-diphosphate-sugar epimerase
VVSGGTGFVGGQIVSELVNRRMPVCVITRFPDIYKKFEIPGLLEYWPSDFSSLEKNFHGKILDAFVHAATDYGLDATQKIGNSSKKVFDTNFYFARDCFRLAESSSCRVFINLDTSFSKTEFFRDRLAGYVQSKVDFLNFLRDSNSKMDILNLRLEHIFGPGDSLEKFIPATALDLLSNVSELRFTPGNQVRDFTYVLDVVDLVCFLILNRDLNGSRFLDLEVGSGVGTRLSDFVILMKKLANSSSSLHFGALEYERSEIMYSVADTRSLSRIGWSPSWNVENGIQALLAKLNLRL